MHDAPRPGGVVVLGNTPGTLDCTPMLPFDPLLAVLPLGAAASLASGALARRAAALAAACFALGHASLAAAAALAGPGGIAGVPAFSLRVDAGLELLGLGLALAGALAAWRAPHRSADRVAALLLLLAAATIAATALPHLATSLGGGR